MTQRRRVRLVIVAGVGAVALGLAIAALAFWMPQSTSPSDCTPPTPMGFTGAETLVMATCHSVVPSPSHSVKVYQVGRLSDTEKVEGQYAVNLSSYGAFDAYLLNTTQYGNLMSGPQPAAPLADGQYFYHCGGVPECNLSVAIPGSPIAYYIALVNYGNVTVAFEWTQALTMFYVPH